MATVLITGGCGFLGRRLAETLLRRGEITTPFARGGGGGEAIIAAATTGGCQENEIDQFVSTAVELTSAAIGARDLVACSKTPISKLIIVDVIEPKQPLDGVHYVTGDISGNPKLLESLLTKDVSSVFHLAGIMSGQSETDFDLGMKVNVGALSTLINRCRTVGHCPRFIFTSSVAVFGIFQTAAGGKQTGITKPATEASSTKDDVEYSVFRVNDDSMCTPQSSYGTEKVIGELLIADASRRGWIDGRVVRLPSVVIRSGRLSSAASSFMTSVLREPLHGRPVVCPVREELAVWIQSPRMVIDNIIHAHAIANLSACLRVVTLPALSVTVREMLQTLEELGKNPSSLVTFERDPLVERIVGSWPGYIATPYAEALGFCKDETLGSLIRCYIEDDMHIDSEFS